MTNFIRKSASNKGDTSVRRHAKASSAGSTSGIGSSRRPFGRAFATRGASSDADGSGAPSHRRLSGLLVAVAALALLAFAPTAQATFSVHHYWGNSSESAETTGGKFSTSLEGVAVNDTTGNVYVADRANNRIEEFTAAGAFIRAWGRDVTSNGATNTGFEICEVAAECKAGITSPGAQGGTFNAPRNIAINQSTGDVYVTDFGNLRVQRFSSSGSFIRAWGDGVADGGAAGTGTVTNGSPTISSVVVTSKTFLVGEEISGTGIAPGTLVTAVASGSITMSQNATPAALGAGTVISAPEAIGNVPRNEKQKYTLGSNSNGGKFKLTFAAPTPAVTTAVTSAAINWNASPAEVQTALEGMSNIGAGNVAVTSPNPGGGGVPGGPYFIEFKGRYADTDVGNITAPAANLTELTVSSGSKTFTVSPEFSDTEGAVVRGGNAPETCTVVVQCKVGVSIERREAGVFNSANPTGSAIAIAPAGAPNAGNVLVSDPGNMRVQEFTSAGVFVRAFGWGVVSSGPGETKSLNQNQSVSVSASEGTFKLTFSGQQTGPIKYNATAAEVQSALNGLSTIGGAGGSAAVTGGPGGTAAYIVTLGGTLGGGTTDPLLVADPSGLTAGSKTVTVTAVPGFQVCNASAGDACRAGLPGVGVGQFQESSQLRVAEDTTGAIYVTDNPGSFGSAARRLQKFTAQGGPTSLSPSEFAPATLSETSSSGGPSMVAIDPTTNSPYVVKTFKVGERVGVFGPEIVEELRILKFNSSGVLQETWLPKAEIKVINGLAIKAGGAAAYITSTTGAPRVYAIQNFAEPTFTLEEPTNVEPESAVLHATISPAPATVNTTYQFEYSNNGLDWSTVPASFASVGNGSGGALDPKSCPTGNPATCEVSQEIGGLRAHFKYFFRIVVKSELGSPQIVEGTPFITGERAPTVETGDSRWSSPIETNPSLLLIGTLNAHSERTTYLFQYVSQEKFEESEWEHAEVAPIPPNPPAEAGHGYQNVTVKQVVTGLDASKTYRYRLVASSVTGTTFGNARTVMPPNSNARYYEWVSAVDSQNIGVKGFTGISGNGERAIVQVEAVGQPRSLPSLYVPAITVRSPSGWAVHPTESDPEHAAGELFAGILANQELSAVLWGRATLPECEKSQYDFYIGNIDGTYYPTNPKPIVPLEIPAHAELCTSIYPSSTDSYFHTITMFPRHGGGSPLPYVPGEPHLGFNKLDIIADYNVGTPNAYIAMANVNNSGEQIGGGCGAGVGGNKGENAPNVSTHAISDDGSIIWFNSNVGAPFSGYSCGVTVNDAKVEEEYPRQIFERVNDAETIEVSASKCTRVKAVGPPVVPACNEVLGGPGFIRKPTTFQGASSDGKVAILTTENQLTNSDTDNTTDVYLYDNSPPPGQPKLVQASAGEVVAGAHEAVGSGAKVTEVYNSSFDGSRTYFVAEGVLTGANSEGKSPTAGAKNLYLFERDNTHPTGVTQYVTQLSTTEGKEGKEGRAQSDAYPMRQSDQKTPGDGHVLFFATTRQVIPAEDHDSVRDLYVYNEEAAVTKIKCVTCAGNGSVAIELPFQETRGNPETETRAHLGSNDGTRAVFATTEALSPEDENTVSDIYEWHNGVTTLVSGATGPYGASEPRMSEDGRDIFFNTGAQLLLADGNTAPDIYDARIGGGFPEAKGQVVSCQTSVECHEPPGPTPNPPVPTSVNFHGPGNPPVQEPKKCGAGKVLKHGKCVKKATKKHHKKRHAKRAGANHGGAK